MNTATPSRLFPFAGVDEGRRHVTALHALSGATTMWRTAWVFNRRALAFDARRGHVDAGSDVDVFEDERHESRILVKTLSDP